MFDCIIIGAGPAGLFFADEYLKNSSGKRIAVVDMGVSLSKRSCPLVDRGDCRQCKCCLAVYGSGGAGMYSDGKLSSYPAGSGLESHFGNAQTVISLNQKVLSTIEARVQNFSGKRSCGSDSSSSELAEKTKKIGSNLKSYDVVHLGTEGIQEFCLSYEAELETSGLEFLWRNRLLSISRKSGVYELHCDRPGMGRKIYHSRNVVLATGKASGTLIRKHFNDLGVVSESNKIEMGVRVETDRSAIDPLSNCHLDAKLKFSGLFDSEIRTFCVCNGGYLVSCYYDDFLESQRVCTISGFSFKNRQSENSNFGLLVRRAFPTNQDAIKEQLEFVKRINIASGHGGTVVQRYEDFLKGRATTTAQLEKNSIKSTLPSSTPSELNRLLPEYVSKNIRRGMSKLELLSEKISSPDTLLHAPVWELVHDRPVIDRNFGTTAPGFYVIGDATGIARGIVQAASTGMWAGRALAMQADESALLTNA